jgi:hypothetical protein
LNNQFFYFGNEYENAVADYSLKSVSDAVINYDCKVHKADFHFYEAEVNNLARQRGAQKKFIAIYWTDHEHLPFGRGGNTKADTAQEVTSRNAFREILIILRKQTYYGIRSTSNSTTLLFLEKNNVYCLLYSCEIKNNCFLIFIYYLIWNNIVAESKRQSKKYTKDD